MCIYIYIYGKTTTKFITIGCRKKWRFSKRKFKTGLRCTELLGSLCRVYIKITWNWSSLAEARSRIPSLVCNTVVLLLRCGTGGTPEGEGTEGPILHPCRFTSLPLPPAFSYCRAHGVSSGFELARPDFYGRWQGSLFILVIMVSPLLSFSSNKPCPLSLFTPYPKKSAPP